MVYPFAAVKNAPDISLWPAQVLPFWLDKNMGQWGSVSWREDYGHNEGQFPAWLCRSWRKGWPENNGDQVEVGEGEPKKRSVSYVTPQLECVHRLKYFLTGSAFCTSKQALEYFTSTVSPQVVSFFLNTTLHNWNILKFTTEWECGRVALLLAHFFINTTWDTHDQHHCCHHSWRVCPRAPDLALWEDVLYAHLNVSPSANKYFYIFTWLKSTPVCVFVYNTV